jgi:hypothetical protein
VWVPAAVGLAFCALGLWAGLVYTHNQATFQAHAVPAQAVIDQVTTTGTAVTYGGRTSFDQYGLVHFQAQGRTAHARVLLVPGCEGACFPAYRVGQVLTVYYSPQNLGYAELKRPGPPTWTGLALAVWLCAFCGLIALVAAAVNLVAAVQDRRRAGATGPPASAS